MEDIPEEKHDDKEDEEEEDDNEEKEESEDKEGEEEEDDEEEEKKTESKKSKNSQKNSKTSKKLVLDASSKGSNLPEFNNIIKSESDFHSPSVHYSDKYKKSEVSSKKSKISKNSKLSKISELPTFNKAITSENNQEINPPSIHYSDKYSKNSIRTKSNSINLPTFNEVMNSDPNQELRTPSVHYSGKYGKKLKKIDKGLLTFNEVLTAQNQENNPPSVHYSEKYRKNSLNSIKSKSINSKNSNLPTFNQVTTNTNQETNPPSIHYSEKYDKNSLNSNKSISKNSKNSNLPTFNQVTTNKSQELYPPSVHFSEKYDKNSKISSVKSKSNKSNKSKKSNSKKSELITFNEYMNSKQETDNHPPSIHYSEKYGKNNKEEEVKNQEKEKEKYVKDGTSELPMFNDYIQSDPEFDLASQKVNFEKRYGDKNNEIQSIRTKKSQKSKKSTLSTKFILGNVDKERVIVPDEKEKENLPKILCSNCHKFPLEMLACTECNHIYCGVCINNKAKCLNCNSVLKIKKKVDEYLENLFSSCKIICKYAECGCQEQIEPKELLTHEKTCKNKERKCDNCNEKMTYEKYLTHYKECKLDLAECESCGYKDSVHEYEKTNKKIEHIRHILMPEIENIIKREVNNAINAINDSLDQREAHRPPPDSTLEDNLKKNLLDIQQLLLNMQSKDYLDKSDDIAKMTKANYLDRKIKNVKPVLTIPSKLDNVFDCNDKYCIIHTFKNDNMILYPNIKYGINCYSLTSSKDIIILPKVFESNITCMSSCQNAKKNLTYFAAASYDCSIKVYTVENGFKKLKTYRDIFEDYSNFSIDLYSYNNQVILLAGNSNFKKIKVLYPEEGENEKNLMKKMNCNNKISFLKHNPANEEEFFMGNDEGIFLYNIFNLIGEGDDENKKIDIEKEYIDKSEEKSKHICITFIQEDKNFFIEGDSLGVVRVWTIKEGELRIKIKRGILKYQIYSLDAWSGRTVIGGTKDGKIIIYDILEGIAVGEIGEHKGCVNCIKIAENWKYEKIVTSCGYDGQLKIWASIDS